MTGAGAQAAERHGYERHGTKDKASDNSEGAEGVSDTMVAMTTAKIVPGVIEAVRDSCQLTVLFNDKPVSNGQEVTLTDLASEPRITIKGCAHSDVFHLICVDPDMPSPAKPIYKDTIYWMVNNIKANGVGQGDFTVEYMAPEPAQGTHRYVFLLFQQPDSAFKKFTAPAKRINFQTKQWAKDHGLGDPAAALYVTASHGK